MKKSLILILCGLLLSEPPRPGRSSNMSSRAGSGPAVITPTGRWTSRLDQGGEAFAYLHAEGMSEAGPADPWPP